LANDPVLLFRFGGSQPLKANAQRNEDPKQGKDKQGARKIVVEVYKLYQ
jgi:hypothetical protein